jgi:2-phospho-L-lactate guanylyltransferase
LAAQFAALPLLETTADLNAALEQACRQAAVLGGNAALILPADLPRLRMTDLHDLVATFDDSKRVVIVPSGDGGTNALLLPLPAPFAFAFGPDSYCVHCVRATDAGCAIQSVLTATLRFDLDSPRDWDMLTADASFSAAALLENLPF